MIMYWTMFIAPAILSLSEPIKQNYRGVHFTLISLFVFLWLVISFRETGGDYTRYVLVYNMISNMSMSDAMLMTEPSYGFLNWLSAQLGWEMYGVNAICAIIFLFGLYKFTSDEPKQLLALSIAMPYLVTVTAIGYTRQGVAIGILLYAIYHIRRYHPVRAAALIFFAATFHNATIITMPIVYFAVQSKNIVIMRLVRYGTVVASLAAVSLLFSDKLNTHWQHYVESNHYSSQGALIRSLMGAAAGVVVVFYYKNWKTKFNDAPFWLIFALLSFVSVPLTSIASTAVDRMGLYLIPLQIVAFSRLPVFQKNTEMAKLAVLGVIFLYALTLLVWLHFGQFASVLWLPYQSLIFGVIE